MTAVEEIHAAIEKLTAQRDKSTPGPWAVDDTDKCSVYYIDGGATILQPEDWYPRGDNRPAGNAQLVVTLHNTIDAQLAILRDFMERYEGRAKADWTPVASGAINALNLARAINGSAS